jgi:hypothetical protein
MSHLYYLIGHYRNPALYRVLAALLSTFYRALGKAVFVEGRTRQIPTLGNDHVYRELYTWHRECFVVCQTLGEPRRSAKGRQQPSIDDGRYLCREPGFGTRQSSFFGECQTSNTRLSMLCRVSFLDRGSIQNN